MTAKGGDRTKGFVQWRMLRIFLAYLALNVAGILWAFVLDDFALPGGRQHHRLHLDLV